MIARKAGDILLARRWSGVRVSASRVTPRWDNKTNGTRGTGDRNPGLFFLDAPIPAVGPLARASMKSTLRVDEIPQSLRYEMRLCRMKYPPAGGYEIRRWRGVCFVGISCRQSKRGTALEKQCLAQLTTYETQSSLLMACGALSFTATGGLL